MNARRGSGGVFARGSAAGPLWGRGRLLGDGPAHQLEAAVAARHGVITDALEHVGLRQGRRPLTVCPEGLRWRLDGAGLVVEFSLPAGSYATSVLREVGGFEDAGTHRCEGPA